MKTSIPLFLALIIFSCNRQEEKIGSTTVTKWQDGKTGAISITLDDASINQFRQALPIMDTLGIKATFFIIMSQVQGSIQQPRFLGRPIAEIIKETATVPTNKDNLFERASAIRFTGIKEATELHNSAGTAFEANKPEEAYKIIDEAYQKVRQEKAFEKKPNTASRDIITWPEVKAFAANGHEFGSHTLSHPRLSVLDEQNLLFELEKSKEELANQLGPDHTFSAECPFGTENERVMEYALKTYPALRNRMPESFLEELNRSSTANPSGFQKEYVQWQRGPLKKTTLDQMKSYVDTLLVHDNIWLVLTFHGVDGIGWEAIPHEVHAAYFRYMKEREDKVWIATFGDATKYMRERMNAIIHVNEKAAKIVLTLTHSLDANMYKLPLTLKTYVSGDWKSTVIRQGTKEQTAEVRTDESGSYVLYRAVPDGTSIEITQP